MSSFSANKTLSNIALSLSLAVLLLALAFTSANAKPLQQNQIRFRRLPPKKISAPLGSNIAIECEAGGSPQATIHWLKNGKKIYQNIAEADNLIDQDIPVLKKSDPKLELSATRSRLHIDCASIEDEATYTCVAENIYSRISSDHQFSIAKPVVASGADNDIQGYIEQTSKAQSLAEAATANADASSLEAIPQCLREKTQDSEPVRITMWSHNMVELMKNDIVIFCRSNRVTSSQLSQRLTDNQRYSSLLRAKLLPLQKEEPQAKEIKTASLTWTLPDEKLVSSSDKEKYEILDTGDLLIKDLRWSDMGSYVCNVADENSSDSVSTFVYPTRIRVEKSSSSSSSSTTSNEDVR